MVRVRLDDDPKPPPRLKRRPTPSPKPEPPVEPDATTAPRRRGLTERQWFLSLLVVSGLLLLIAFRGCILPSGVGPKAKPAAKPTPAASGPPVQQNTGTEYTVQSGDNLSAIAQKTGVSLDALLQANGLNRSSILSVGQKLKIPR